MLGLESFHADDLLPTEKPEATASQVTSDRRASVWILGDQLVARHPALAAAEQNHPRDNLRIVLVESGARSRRLPYQRKKLVLLFSAMRHYAAQLREEGYAVDYIQAPTFLEGLQQHTATWRPDHLFVMQSSEWPERRFQQTRLRDSLDTSVTILPNVQFLVGQFDPYPGTEAGRRVIMEGFYRRMRRHFNVLMTTDGEPVGGQWNHDTENRKPLPRDAQPPPVLPFEPDAITREVMNEVEASGHGMGTVRGFSLAVTREQALIAVQDFVERRLGLFGPYEDAMSSEHPTIYHSLLSPYLNIGLLEPLELIGVAERAYHGQQAPLNSAEGFIRQILGWREYIYWQYWRLMPGLMDMNSWDAQRALPDFFWDGRTEMNCLNHAISRAIQTGYNHHIERLMLLCNFCLLAGVNPRAVNEWFLSSYMDAFEWVMVPNVIGMGLNADGGVIATKPYIASANYINKMSDYCRPCRFDHKRRIGADACPFNFLYWNFLLEHETTLRAKPRLGRSVFGLSALEADERRLIRHQARTFLDGLKG